MERLSSVAAVTVVLLIVLALLIAGIGTGLSVARRRAIGGTPKPVHIDAFTIGEPWRRHVSAAQSTQRRFTAIVATVQAGPLRDRLTAIGRQVQRGVEEGWLIAKRGDEVDNALQRIDTSSIRAQLARATDDDAKASLQNQLDAGARIRAIRDDTDQRLRTLNSRLDQLVAQAAEVSLGSDATGELGTGVDDVITELEALRLAINDVNAVAGDPSTDGPGVDRDGTDGTGTTSPST
ncbi:MAG: hypothetical protein JWM12_2180 [Ilumatobacteraceae bacterium]|nr:hypothetical protein [Ilumatobacteraceae bacterium]